jgi:putative ABC transport system permease protein
MPVLLRIAVRNLLQHRSKTLIIGVLMTLGVVILITGNSMMSTAQKGIERSFTGNFTGNVFIHGIAGAPVSLFGVQSSGSYQKTPVIPRYQEVRQKVAGLQGLQEYTSQVSGLAQVSVEGITRQHFTLLFGIAPESYRQTFDNLTVTAGRYLQAGEEGIMLSEKQLEEFETQLEVELSVGDELLLTGFGSAGFRIREVPIRGIYTYDNASEAMNTVAYIDAQSLRALNGMFLGGAEEVQLAQEETALLDSEDPEALFGGGEIVRNGEAADGQDPDALAEQLGAGEETAGRPAVDTGAWHFLLLSLKDSASAERVIAELNSWFAEQGIAARAGDWKAAAGPYASTVEVVRGVFNGALAVVAVVAVIIMMNTLVISVIDRTREIGTMRALGAQKGFVWRLFILETLAISIVFGLIGIGIGIGVLAVISAVGIPASNEFLQILFAGPELRPELDPAAIWQSLLVTIGIGILAHLYPVSVALKISPRRAIDIE